MRKLVLQMMMTLDGFIAGDKGELDWIDNDPALGEAHTALAKGADAALIGAHLYKDMSGFWPAVAAGPDAAEAAFAKLMNDMKKIVIANKPETLEWNNSEQLQVESEADLVKKVQELKDQDGQYLLAYGGVQTVQTLAKHGLIDEYRLDMCPVVLGSGKKLFVDRAELELVSSTPYASGTVTVTYRPKGAKAEAVEKPATPPAAQSEESVEFGSWAKILVVEDNTALADIYKTHMEMIGYICFVAHEGNEALAMIEKERPSLVLLDLMVPGVAGDQILKRMRASDWGKDIKVLVISNLNEEDAPTSLRSDGIEGYAVKANLTDDQLDQMVNKILEKSGKQSDAAPKPA